MGIFDVFRKKQEEAVEQDTTLYTVKSNKIMQWLTTQFGKDINAAREMSNLMSSNAINSVSNIKDNLQKLELSSFGDKDKVYSAANMAKNSFVKRTLSIIEGVRFSDIKTDSYSGLQELNTRLSGIIKEISKISPKQLYLLSRYFKNESRQYTESVKQLESKNAEIQKFLENEGTIMKMKERIESYSDEIIDLMKKSSSSEAEEQKIQAEISEIEELKKESISVYEKIVGGKEWKELNILEESVKKNELRLNEIESNANEILNNAKRPLKKLGHLSESREKFPENPFMRIVIDGAEARFMDMMKNALTKADKMEITLKQRDIEKLNETLKYLETEAQKTKDGYRKIRTMIVEEKSRIPKFSIITKKNDIEKKMMDNEERLKKKWAELDEKIKERKGIESRIKYIKESSEKLVLEEGYKRIQIDMQ